MEKTASHRIKLSSVPSVIITLLQEDNIFGTNASLTYVLSYDIYDVRKGYLFTVCTEQLRSRFDRATQPYSLGEGGEVRFVQVQD